MIDLRFYEALGPVTVRALAPSMEIGGDAERQVTSIAPADRAGPQDLCYYEAKAKAAKALTNAPAACVISAEMAHLAPNAGALILSPTPRASFAQLAIQVARPRSFAHRAPVLDPSAKLEASVRIAPGAVIGAGVQIGAEAEIGPNVIIGPGVAIGRRSRIGAGASIFCALIGDDVELLAGVVIGEAGFGMAETVQGPVDVPHFGRVIIQDRVTIGANSCVDRGVFDDTIVAEDAKIDNLCHIAHNVVVGRGARIAAFGGISGSTVLGDGVTLGGRVGIGDHRNIGARATLAGGAAVFKDVPAGETWTGYPAKPLRQWMREQAWLSRKVGARNEGE
jgi:UDP-3-O-[3-hydroxymyristoyl] glucosamine N-acyltransferase